MQIQQHGKILEIWLTQEDQASPEVTQQLKKLYHNCKQHGQLPVVYRSGTGDLFQSTSALLRHNRIRSAQIAAGNQR